MDHANYAPDTHRHRHHHRPDESPSTAGDFTYVRVKTSDADSETLNVAVPIDLADGITTKLRLYRETPDAFPSAEIQIAPSGAPLEPPLAPDQSGDENWIKQVRLGAITVKLPGGAARRFSLEEDAARETVVNLSKGLDVKCALRWPESFPIGPMLDVDISQQP